jgi:hypothetical protein
LNELERNAYWTNRIDGPYLKRGLLVFWLVSLPVLGVLYMMVPTSPDGALFDYIAWMKIRGAPYYKGVAEQNWPGEFLLHELGIRVFGVHFWTYRLVDFIVMQLGTVGIFLFLRRSLFSLAPFIALAIYPIIYVTAGYWMAGQRDIVAAEFLITASAFLIGPAQIFEAIVAGCLIGFAVLIRPTYLSFFCGVLLLDVFGFLGAGPSISRRFGRAFACGFILMIGSAVVVGWLTNSLGDWYDQTILFNFQSYSSKSSTRELLVQLLDILLRWWHWMAVFGAVGFSLWLYRCGQRPEHLLLLGIGGTVVLSYFVQGKDLGYHLGGLIPVLVLLTAVCIDELQQGFGNVHTAPRKTMIGGIALAVVIISILGIAKKAVSLAPQTRMLASGEFQPAQVGEQLSAEEIRTLVDYIQAGSTPNDYFFQWGRNFEVGYLAQRRSSSRFISTPALDTLSDQFKKSKVWLTEFNNDLITKPPVFILVARSQLNDLSMPLSISDDVSQAFRTLIGRINEDYQIAVVSDKAVLFEIRKLSRHTT